MRRLAAQLVSHPISAVGVVLAVASGCVFAGLVLLHLLGSSGNPYADIVVFVMLPTLFAVGLLLMPIGLWFHRRRPQSPAVGEAAWPRLDLNSPETRRALFFVAAATFASLVALSFASQRAVEYSESQQFCGQTCHQPMGPHFTAHQNGLHSRVKCVECHIEPGAQGFLKAKLNGTNQLRLVISNRYPRPIVSPTHTARPNAYTSCEQCHWPDRFIGDVVKVVYEFADDEIFPEMKIGWGTYPDRVGHTTSQGCFRCHDESLVTNDGRVLGQDCELCHSIE